MKMTSPFKLVTLLLLALLYSSPVHAQSWALEKLEESPRHLEWVTVKNGDREVKTFVAYPENPKKAKVVLVIHEIFGLTDWARLTADQLASEGYIAVAPDLLSGMAPNGGGTAEFGGDDKARKAVGELPSAQVVADLKAVANYGKSLPASDGSLAVTGFCWGGSQTFLFATESDVMTASFPFYGTAPEDKTALEKITAPVYGFYAENDARVNATLPETSAAMEGYGKAFKPVIYPGAGHGFMRAGLAPDATEANKKARAEAWDRLLKLLK